MTMPIERELDMTMVECKGYAHASKERCIAAVMQVYREDGEHAQTVRHYFYPLLGRELVLHEELEQGDEDLVGAGQCAYNWLAGMLSDARKEGLIPWEIINDPGRRRWEQWYYADLDYYLDVASRLALRVDVWRGQPRRLLLTVEKDGLFDFAVRTATPYHVPVVATKGYPSTTVIHDIAEMMGNGRGWTVLHVGDFDPSGDAIERQIRTGLNEMGARPEVVRIALTQDQTLELPTEAGLKLKAGDSRTEQFKRDYGPGQKGFEIESLPSRRLEQVIKSALSSRMDMDAFRAAVRLREAVEREHARRMARYSAKFRKDAFASKSPFYRDFSESFTDLYLYEHDPDWHPGASVHPEPEPWRS